jgi:hypothetical protein
MKRAAIAIAALLLFGAARLPYELHLLKLQQEAGFRTVSLNTPLRDQIGQMAFLASLSGFRSLVATILWIEAHEAWQDIEWGRMAGLFDTVTTLQPRVPLYWDMSAWHMAWNASQAAIEDEAEPSEALRRLAQQQYWDRGKKYYEDGLRSNPDSALLWEGLGRLYLQKYQDHAAAAAAYATGATKPDARHYLRRVAAYELAKVPGKEREAYQKLKALYDKGPTERMPTVISTLKELEEKLGIPADQRIKEERAP